MALPQNMSLPTATQVDRPTRLRPVQAHVAADRRPSMLDCRRGKTAAQRREVFAVALRHLCSSLAEASRSLRSSLIAGLSLELRVELIRLRETQLRSTDLSQASLPEASKSSPSQSRGTSRPKRHRDLGSVWTVAGSAGRYQRVRLSLGRVILTSGRLSSPAKAEALLRRIRCAIAAVEAAEGGEEASLRAAAAVAAEEFVEVSFQAELDARAVLGRRLVSRHGSLDEALALRQQLQELRAQGSSAVGKLCSAWAQEKRHSRGRVWRMSEGAAAKALDAIAARSGPTRAVAARAAQKRTAPGSDSRSSLIKEEFQSKRIRRLAARAERALKALRSSKSKRLIREVSRPLVN